MGSGMVSPQFQYFSDTPELRKAAKPEKTKQMDVFILTIITGFYFLFPDNVQNIDKGSLEQDSELQSFKTHEKDQS